MISLTDIYASSDPKGWDACKASGEEFTGGSLYKNVPIGTDFAMALAVLSGEEVSIAESVSAVDLTEYALDLLSRNSEFSEDNEPPKYGPFRYLTGAAVRQRKARNSRDSLRADIKGKTWLIS